MLAGVRRSRAFPSGPSGVSVRGEFEIDNCRGPSREGIDIPTTDHHPWIEPQRGTPALPIYGWRKAPWLNRRGALASAQASFREAWPQVQRFSWAMGAPWAVRRNVAWGQPGAFSGACWREVRGIRVRSRRLGTYGGVIARVLRGGPGFPNEGYRGEPASWARGRW